MPACRSTTASALNPAHRRLPQIGSGFPTVRDRNLDRLALRDCAAAHRSTAQARRAACLARPSTDRRTPRPIDRSGPRRARQDMPAPRMAAAVAIARALIAGSIDVIPLESSAESPASRMRGACGSLASACRSFRECRRSRRSTSARRRRRRDARATTVSTMSSMSGNVTGLLAARLKIVDELRRATAARPPASDERNTAATTTSSAGAERAREVVLEHAAARRGRARLEDRPDAPPGIARCAAPTASRARRSDDARSRRAP